jgi:carboxypeptidase Q
MMDRWADGRMGRVACLSARSLAIVVTAHLPIRPSAHPLAAQDVVPRLAGALLGDTPMVEDLRSLTDKIGGRPAGSPSNLRAIDWALDRFRAANVPATKEAFRMPGLWLERSATSVVRGAGVEFAPRIAAMPYSTGTRAGLTAPLVDGGLGREEDYRALGSAARGAFVLIEMPELRDLDGLP